MKSIEEIRNDLRGIQHYYRNKETFDSSIELLGKPSFYDTMEKYEKYIVNAPKRLQDVYECLYRQGKAQKIVEIKEIQLSMTIDTHDLEVKAKHAKRFLEAGNKVKVSIKMRGRQQAYSAKGIEIVNNFCTQVEEFSTKEKDPKVEGRNVVVVLSPKTKK